MGDGGTDLHRKGGGMIVPPMLAVVINYGGDRPQAVLVSEPGIFYSVEPYAEKLEPGQLVILTDSDNRPTPEDTPYFRILGKVELVETE